MHPGHSITLRGTPELAKAARVSLERRLASGGGGTGWSRAWIVNHFARLGDGDKALENLTTLLAMSTLPNLFDNHPPFQIDGNFGGTAGRSTSSGSVARSRRGGPCQVRYGERTVRLETRTGGVMTLDGTLRAR